MRVIDKAVEASFSKCQEAVMDMVRRSDDRVDHINAMVLNLTEMARSNGESARETASLFRIAVERYSAEIAEMRSFRDRLEKDVERLQGELNASMAINAELVRSNELLIAQLTKLNINVKS